MTFPVYTARRAFNGRWHTVRILPGCDVVTSVMDAPSEHAAREEAARLNRIEARQAQAAQVAAMAPQDRPIPKGFYTDEDAR